MHGNTSILISGGNFGSGYTYICGGGAGESFGRSDVKGNASVTIEGGAFNNTVVMGGGMIKPSREYSSANVGGDTFVILSGDKALGAAAGIAGAALAGRFSIAEELLTPLVAAVKAVPVASFVILILIWVSSKNLSVVISFLMVFPILYTNTRNGLRELDTALLEMTDVFQVPRPVRLRWVILPQLYPYIRTGCSLSLGLCWKAGTAAEVIGIPNRSIGEHLYQAKIYLDTPGLFAWTAAIVYVSFCLEKAVLKGMDLAEKRMLVMK